MAVYLPTGQIDVAEAVVLISRQCVSHLIDHPVGKQLLLVGHHRQQDVQFIVAVLGACLNSGLPFFCLQFSVRL